MQAIWHPWDDDLTVGPLGSYEIRLSIRDIGGSGWDIVALFEVVPEPATCALLTILGLALSIRRPARRK